MQFVGFYTSVRVVCANTIRLAFSGKKGRSFSIHHGAKITSEMIADAKKQLGLAIEATERYEEVAYKMSKVSVDAQDTYRFVASLVQPTLLEKVMEESTGVLAQILAEDQKRINAQDFKKQGRDLLNTIAYGAGQDMDTTRDTVWGLLNGATNYVDHVAGRGRDTALASAWFGTGATLKEKAYNYATELVTARN